MTAAAISFLAQSSRGSPLSRGIELRKKGFPQEILADLNQHEKKTLIVTVGEESVPHSNLIMRK